MEKTFSFGKHAIASNRKVNEVEVTVRLYDNQDGRKVFSACADVWNSKHTDIVMGGQCLDDIHDRCKALRNNRLFSVIFGLWKRNHLNDLHAGDEVQEAEIEKLLSTGRRYDYYEVCDYLRKLGIYIHDGYEYGHGCKYRAISDDDMKMIEEIMA